VCRALEVGRQIMLLRKGGISESIGGFELEHRSFLLFPTYVHQNAAMLKPGFAESLAPAVEPATVTLMSCAVVTDILKIQTRSQVDALDAEHIWTKPLIDMRFQYRPSNPLYLLLLRGYRLTEPVTVDNSPAYAGCKSWVPLDSAITAADAVPVLTDADYKMRERAIREAVSSHAS